MTPLTRDEYNATMQRRKYAIVKGQVVCNLCHGDCGQCGEGAWMRRCQDYLDNKPSLWKRLANRFFGSGNT